MANTYTTVQGDTWDMIAYEQYNDETGMTALLEANLAWRDVVIFSAGTVLAVPDRPVPLADDLPPWRKGGRA